MERYQPQGAEVKQLIVHREVDHVEDLESTLDFIDCIQGPGAGARELFKVGHSKALVYIVTFVAACSLAALGAQQVAHRPPPVAQLAVQEHVVELTIDRDATPSLFCFSIMQMEGYERTLIKAQLDRRAGIFACNEFAVISNTSVPLGNFSWGEVSSWANSAPPVPMGKYGQNGQMTDSYLNTEPFLQAWDTLISSGRIWHHDFIVKVDPDAVVFPDRLREHVRQDNGTAVYYTNCAKWGGNPLLYGSLEVFSKQALQVYAERVGECKSLPWRGWGEDFYMQQCMQMLGINGRFDGDEVGDDRCVEAGCEDYHKVAFHDFKNPTDWLDCYDRAIGLTTTTAAPSAPGAGIVTLT